MTGRLYLDLETANVPDELRDVAAPFMKVDSRLKDPDKIAAALDAKLEATALNGLWGQITAIGYAIEDDEPIALIRQQDEAEQLILTHFKAAIDAAWGPRFIQSRPIMIGHNVQFDIRFLFQRMIVHGIKVPYQWLPIHAKPWDFAIFDIMVEWAGLREYVTLDALCAGLGIDVPETHPGAEMPGLWLQEDYEAIRAHVLADVVAVREVHRRMTG